MKSLKAESANEANIVGSSLLLYRYIDIVIGTFDVLQEFVRQGTDRNKIFDVFCKLTYDDLRSSNLEVVKAKVQRTGKLNNTSIYSKKTLGQSGSLVR